MTISQLLLRAHERECGRHTNQGLHETYAQEIHQGDGAMVIEVDLRLFHFSFGHADFLVSVWMAILMLW